MSKPILNNRIDFYNSGGIINRLDTLVNQSVTNNSSPTFANLRISGDTTIDGNLYVEGNTTVIDSLVSQFQDNIILLNNHELGSGVSLLQAGIEIDRGQSENYRIVYNETTKTFRVGPISSTQPVALREENPLNNGIMVWNSSSSLISSVNTLNIDISINSSTNAINASSGSFWTRGGMGINKDLYINGKINLNNNVISSGTDSSLIVSSPQNIKFSPAGLISIPNGTPLTFGSTNQSIIFNPGSNSWNIQSATNIKFNFVGGIGQSIQIPNQVPITFSTQNEKVYTDSSNNMVIAGNKDIQLNPSGKVLIPLNTPLAFSTADQQIVANAGGDLSIASGNNIFLNPNVNGGYVRITTDNKLKLGGSGNQYIYADSSNNLNLNAVGNVNISTANVKLTYNTHLTWNDLVNLYNDTRGNFLISITGSAGSLVITNTNDSTCSTDGAMIIYGGVNVQKTLNAFGDVVINGQMMSVSNSYGRNILVADGSSTGSISINVASGTSSNFVIGGGGNVTCGNLLEFTTPTDTIGSYYIGRDTITGSRHFNVNLPSYSSDYSSTGTVPTFSITTNDTQTELLTVETDTGNLNVYGSLNLHNTQDAINMSTGTFILNGGLSVAKTIYTEGGININTNNTSAIIITSPQSSSGNLLTLDTTNYNITSNVNKFVVNNSLSINNNLQNNTGSSLVINNSGIYVNNTLYITNDLNLNNNSITNVANPVNSTDAANKAYVDLVKSGLYVKDSVLVATVTAQNLLNDFVVGSTIDNYTLISGDRVLIKNQTNSIENGIYVVQSNSSPPIRTRDLLSGSVASGCFVFVERGSINRNTGWICNSLSGVDVVGTNDITFTQFTGVGDIVPGVGISTTSSTNVIDVSIDNTSIEVNISNNQLRVSSKCLGRGLSGGSGVSISTNTDQSHVTKLGTIISGTWASDNIGVPYGGTGNTQFDKGTLLYGNNKDSLTSSDTLVFDELTSSLGIGINQPTKNIHVSSINDSVILIGADSDSSNNTAAPRLILRHGEVEYGELFISRGDGYYPDSFVLSNNLTSGGFNVSSGAIHLATNATPRITVLNNGNVGINTSTPGYTLEVNGMTKLTDTLYSYGRINISNTSNSRALYVAGGSSFSGIVSINNTSGITGNGNGSFSGGCMVANGGVIIVKDIAIGGGLYVSGGSNLSGLSISSNVTGNTHYIQTPSNGGDPYTFDPIHLVKYTDYNNPIVSFLNNGIVLNKSSSLQIGGSYNAVGGSYTFTNTLGNLYLNPNNVSVTNGCFHIGTSGNLSDVCMIGDHSSNIYWKSSDGILNLNNSSIRLQNTLNNPSYTLDINSPNTAGDLIISNGSNGNVNLNIRTQTTLSNTSGNGTIVYTPGNTSSSLIVGSDVATTFYGDIIINGNLSHGNGVQATNLTNSSLTGNAWIYLGTITGNSQFLLYYNTYSLSVTVNVNGSQLIATNSYTNSSGDVPVPFVNIYNDSYDNYYMFINLPVSSSISLSILYNQNTFNYVNEGVNVYPNGSSSTYDNNTWTLAYTTKNNGVSDNSISIGDTYMKNAFVNNNFSTISYNNINGTKDIGIGFERYQTSNDNSYGDVVLEIPDVVFTLPSQTTINTNQVKLTNSDGSGVDDYYKGWWVKFGSQVRKVVSYSGTQKIFTLDSNWTNIPTNGDSLSFYSKSYVTCYYNENDKAISFGYTPKLTDTLQSSGLVNLNVDNIHCNSLNPSGTVYLSNTSDNGGSGGSLVVAGGVNIQKSLVVSGGLCGINVDNSLPQANLHIKCGGSGGSLLIENNTTSGNSNITFKNDSSFSNINFDNSSSLIFNINSTNAISITSSGNTGIGDINVENILSPLTIANGHLICVDNNTSFIGMNGGNSDTVGDGNAQVVLYGNSSSIETGNIDMYIGMGNGANSSGSFNIYNSTPTSNNLLSINGDGTVQINCTSSSDYSAGSLLVAGGITIQTTHNATCITSGGGITVAGGLSVVKDFYLGGDLHIAGNLNAAGSISQPTISTDNTVNCTVVSCDNINLTTIATQGILTFYMTVTPQNNNGEYCSVEFSLPQKITPLINRGDCILNVSGWVDDTNVIPLFNIIGVGVAGTNNAMIKFASVNTDIHYIQINCYYIF